MTINTQKTIWCDEDGCEEWLQVQTSRKHRARRHARERGWACHGTEDYCPKHNQK